jgi:hypothetical protein
MPVHDWTRVDAGLFHDFHQDWTIELRRALNAGLLPSGYIALVDQETDETQQDMYFRRANRIKIQHRYGQIIAVIEVVSPGSKNTRNAMRAFVRKAANLIWQGIHLLVVDLFPPSQRDPAGIHKAIWDEFAEGPFELPTNKRLTLVAYCAAPTKTAYVEAVAVGDALPTMPIFLAEDKYIPAPLEETYRTSLDAYPADLKELLEPPSG